MGSLEPIEPDRPQDHTRPSLLDEYAVAKDKARLTMKFVGGVILLILAGAPLYEAATRGTYFVLAVESMILAAVLTIALLLSLSGVVAWLAWQFAQNCLDKGETRPRGAHMAAVVGFALVAGLPLGSTLWAQRDLSHGILAFGGVFWVVASCGLLGYLSRFAASGKRFF